ncbi:unnamed protein product [marine sediment metagenome]|uniref:PD(D/E)XK endonuclease domain-containing protein n=1 Tax=marine sediment metagenome TaxID=412755 RepID=X1KI25_9ZZZZ
MAIEIHSVTKGKRSELLMMALLLENGFSVFQALADIKGVDCGVVGRDNHFYPIQIKSRAEFTLGDLVEVRHFQSDMFIIIYDVKTRNYWVIPAGEYKSMSSQRVLENGKVGYRLTLTKKNEKRLENYKGERGIQVLRSKVYSQVSQP